MASSSLVSWISEPLPLQHHDLTSSLHFSLSETCSSSASIDQSVFPEWIGADPFYLPQTSLAQNQTQPLGAHTGRVGKRKRKSRASKRNLTTYISTDTANFRQMVQHVTGVGFDELGSAAEQPALTRPEPKRAAALTEQLSYVLPTLDTSAFLLERNQNESLLPVAGPGSGRDPGFQMDQFSFFPTLESWSVM